MRNIEAAMNETLDEYGHDGLLTTLSVISVVAGNLVALAPERCRTATLQTIFEQITDVSISTGVKLKAVEASNDA